MYDETYSNYDVFWCWVVAGRFLFYFWSARRQHLHGNTLMVKAGDQISGQCGCGNYSRLFQHEKGLCLYDLLHWVYLNLEQVKHLNQCWQLMFHNFICWPFCCFWFLSRALDGAFSILPFSKRCKHCCHFFCFVDIGQLQNVVLCCPWSVLEVRHLSQHVTIQWFVHDRLLLYGDVSCSVISIPPPQRNVTN